MLTGFSQVKSSTTRPFLYKVFRQSNIYAHEEVIKQLEQNKEVRAGPYSIARDIHTIWPPLCLSSVRITLK